MSVPVSGGFQSFQSGCGTCNASKDYADIYYSQNLTLSSPQQGGKKRTTKKRSTSTKKRSTSTKKRSTSTKKRSTSTKKRSTSTKKRTTTIRKMKKMRGGSKEGESQIQLTEQFIKDNLGIAFQTVGGGQLLPSRYFGGKSITESHILPGLGSGIEEKFASVKGGAKKRTIKKKTSTKKRSTKKSTTTKKRKSTKKSSKKKTTLKKH
jgi:hypothetical protein